MTRVSENSSQASLSFSLNKAKKKLEDLQLKGTTLKNIVRPSDDPVANVEGLSISSSLSDNKQYVRNASYAQMQLGVTEKALEQITDILVKAKEIAIAQSSDFYDTNIRKNVANEILQLRNQALAISNKRIGNRYIFAGFNSLKTPFSQEGTYQGDDGHINIEVAKDFFVPINLTGSEVFLGEGSTKNHRENPLEGIPEIQNEKLDDEFVPDKSGPEVNRDLASVNNFKDRDNVFSHLSNLVGALENGDSELIQGLLEKFDKSINRVITLRTRVGAIINSVDSAVNTIESDNIDRETRKSKLMDADIADLFSKISEQQNILQMTYKSTQGLINNTLLDFIR